MKKIVLPIIIVVLLSIMLVALVQNEGEKVRQAARSSLSQPVVSTPSSSSPVENTAPASSATAKSASPSKPTRPLSPDIPKLKSPEDQPTSSPPSTPSPRTPPPSERPKTANPPVIDTNDPIGSVFRTGQSLAKTLDKVGQEFFRLNEADERRVGRDVHKEVTNANKIWRNPSQLARLERLAKPLLDLRSRKNIEFTFTLLDAPEINAFSTLGGYVYINRGLIGLDLSDSELQFVLGHEIAHVDLKHCVEKLSYSARAFEVAGNGAAQIIQLAYHAISLGYSEDQEFEADQWSFRSMRQIGMPREDCLAMIKRFLKQDSKDDSLNKNNDNTIPNKVGEELRNHFASHPANKERLKRLEDLP